MKRQTRLALNAVNQRFYRERAEEFSGTRERPWKGWFELLERINPLFPPKIRVLDVGCGNGRFARFLKEAQSRPFSYVGIDQSPLALGEARRRLPDAKLLEHDFVTSGLPLDLGDFDLVALFGVLHHVPGRSERRVLVSDLARLLTRGGLLALTAWRFDRYERFRGKLVPFEEADVGVDTNDLEPGDFLMTWGGGTPALRYCHAASEEELDELAKVSGLTVAARFDAADEPNTYLVLANQPQSA